MRRLDEAQVALRLDDALVAEVGAGEGRRGAYVAASLRDPPRRADAERVPEVVRALAAAVGAGDHARGIEAVVPERAGPPAPGPGRVSAARREGAGGGVAGHRGVLGQDPCGDPGADGGNERYSRG